MWYWQVSELLGKIVEEELQGKATEKTMNELWKKLDVAEELMKAEMFPNGCPCFQDVKPGYLDIVLYSFLGTIDVVEEFFGYKSFNTERYPLLVSWTKALSQVPDVKDAAPPKPKLLELLHGMRHKGTRY